MIRQPHCFHGVVARTTAPFRFTKNMAPTFYIGAKIIDNKQQIRTPFRLRKCSDYGVLVRVTGLEPALLSEAAPKTAVYANFTTPANIVCVCPACVSKLCPHTPANTALLLYHISAHLSTKKETKTVSFISCITPRFFSRYLHSS